VCTLGEKKENTNSITEDIMLHSIVLNKDMNIRVYLPMGYVKSISYPVLFLLHGFNQNEEILTEAEFDKRAEELINAKVISPLIIASVRIDNSFGINSSVEYKEVEVGTDGSRTIHFGRYEDYLITEVIPYIEEHYSTTGRREDRYIGGISMGGFTALYAAFKYNKLFSKVGAHMPALFLKYPFEGMEKWLYPTEELRHERCPFISAEYTDLSSLEIYLDCGRNDRYELYKGCDKLNDILRKRKAKVVNHLNEGGHTTQYLKDNAAKYLMFYGGSKQS
jgi:enterochelin esterase-like enzyme